MDASSQALQEEVEHRASVCLATELQEVSSPLRIQGRELSGHGAARVHRDPTQKVFMRWLLRTPTGFPNRCPRPSFASLYTWSSSPIIATTMAPQRPV